MYCLLHSSLPTTGKDLSKLGVENMRKNYRKSICAFFFSIIMMAIMPLICLAEEEKEKDTTSLESSVSILDTLESCGQLFFCNTAVEKPTTSINHRGFTAGIWNNTNTTSYSLLAFGSASYTENNLALSYSRNLGILHIAGGYVSSTLIPSYSGGPNPLNFHELFFKLGINAIFSPTLIISRDIDRYQWTASLNLTHKIEFNQDIQLIYSAYARYSRSDNSSIPFNYDNDTLFPSERYNNSHSGVASLSLPISVTKTLIVAPTVVYAFSFSDDAKRELKGHSLAGIVNPLDRDGVFAYCGISIGLSF
jgi:hypothetical protein